MSPKRAPASPHVDVEAEQNGKKWPADSAGSMMTSKVPTVHPDQTIGEAQSLVFHYIKVFKSIDYIFVLDRKKKLYGILSVKDLYGTPRGAYAGNMCKRRSLVTVRPETHQERVAYLAIKNNIKAVPVVGPEREFLGVILNDTILTILHKETHEDLLRLAGVHPHAAKLTTMQTPLLSSFGHRAPWLLFGLVGGLFSAAIIGLFEQTLERNLILASFIPLIVYMSSAVGMQMEASLIRDLALEHEHFPFLRYFLRQASVTLGIAVSFSALLAGIIVVQHGQPALAVAAGIALCVATLSSVVTSLVIPYVFNLLRFDPADVSGPVATILQDLTSVTIYFAIATWLL